MAKPTVDVPARWVLEAASETAMLLIDAVQCLLDFIVWHWISGSCDEFVMQGAGGPYTLAWYQH